ncbi:MAG TPA: hypothetical protein VHJ20_01190 [Polyangia bacterium]|nr:hypothetical protein [Polyangia bacterium]
MAVDVHRHADVRVAQDALHGGRVRAEHHEQRGGGMACVVEADREHLPDGPELHVALRAAAQVPVGGLLGVAAALAAALMHVARDDIGLAQRRAEDRDEVDVLRVTAAVGAREQPHARRRFERLAKVRDELLGDRDAVLVAALRRGRVVRATDVEQSSVKIDVALLERDDLALAQPRVDAGREDAAPALGHAVEDLRYPLGL